MNFPFGKNLVLFNMSSTALVKAASTAVSNRIIQKTASQAVKSAAPAIAKAALTAALTKASTKQRTGKVTPSKSKRTQNAFAPVSYTTSFTNSGKIVRISQSEVIQSLVPDKKHWIGTTPTDYTILGLRLSPSNSTTFPWLSNIAGLFDKFRFRKLRFTYVTTQPTNTPGNVAMAIDFDAYDKPPGDFVDMSNLAKFTTTPVYVNKTIEVPLNHPGNKSWYYNFDGNNGDLKTYNLGTFYLCLSGVDVAKPVGYLVVDYDVELCDKNPTLVTVSTTVDDDRFVDAVNTTSHDPPTPPEEDQDPWQFWFTDSNTIVNPTNFFEFTDSGSLYFRNVQGGQNIIGTLYWFDPAGTMTCTPGASPETTNNAAVGSYRLVGNGNLIAVSFALTVNNDGDVTMNIPVTGVRDKTNLGTVFAKDANTSR